MIDTRLLAYMALAFVLLLIYQAWMADYGPEPVTSIPQEESVSHKPAAQDLPEADFSRIPTPASAPDEPGVMERSSISISDQQISIESDVLRLKVDLQGGTIVSADLLDYPVDLQHPDTLVRIFDTEKTFYVAQSGLQAKNAAAPNHYADYSATRYHYELEQGANELIVPLVWQDSSDVRVTKEIRLKRGQYDIEIVHQVINGSDQVWQGLQYRQLQRSFSDEGNKGFIRTYTGGVIYSPENHYEKIDFEDMAEQPLNRVISNGWSAMIQHYFLAAWIPQPEESNVYYSQGVSNYSGQRYVLGLKSPIESIAAGESLTFASTLYVGPKIQDKLEQLAEGLDLTVDYGYLTILSQPLFYLLDWINNFIGNWGWSIIIVTLLIKAAFYKLAETSYRSMANMRRVQPKMMAIRERYADDKQNQSRAMMDLYKKEKINPLGGCLPMVIQIPVFIALYWVLLESVELRQAPFILWIKDLSVKDPFFVLPVVMGVSMYFQQKLNPAPVDPIQAKVFMLLPFVFTVFFAFFPAGLVLYWVVNNLLTIAQQWFITKKVLGNT